MFNIGIIGCGKIAQIRHIPEYADNPNVKLSGYFDLNLNGPLNWPKSTAVKPTHLSRSAG